MSLPKLMNDKKFTIKPYSFCILAMFTLSSCAVSTASDGRLKPFTSDGCSMFPDGTPRQQTLWLSCCTAHDYAYWKGGTYEERKIADIELQQCVAKVADPRLAKLMLAGVRVGGSPYFPTPFRWGYGWPYPRLYKALSEQEKQQVEELKPNMEFQ